MKILIRLLAVMIFGLGASSPAADNSGVFNILDYGAKGDGMVLKNTPNFASYGRSENITVTGCTIKSRSAGLKVDEIYALPGIRNAVFDACVIYQSNRGLCVPGRDEGDIENILFSNITIETQLQPSKWWGAGEVIYVSNRPRHPDTKLGHLRHIRFNNILCKGENGVYLHGSEEQPIEDVVLDNVRVEVGKATDVPGGLYDDRPIGSATAGGQFTGIYTNAIAGIYAREVDGLTLRNTQVVWDTPRNSIYGQALDLDQIQGLDLDHDTYSTTPAAK